MFVIYGYKQGDEDGFEDASSHAFGPFDSRDEAEAAATLLSEDSWLSDVLEVKPLRALDATGGDDGAA